MDSIGDTLRRARLRQGFELQQLAAQTKIGSHYLQAMESNQFDRLPGGLFTRSFLRQYSRTLGLDEEEAVASLPQELKEEPVPTPDPRCTYRPRAYRPRLPLMAWLAIALTSCGFLYEHWERRSGSLLNTFAMTQRTRAHGNMTAKPRLSQPNGVASGMPEPRTPEIPPIARATTTASASGPLLPAVRVLLAASEPVWVSIKADDVPTYSGILEEQQTKEFSASVKLTVLVGNAGGLAISVNGMQVALNGEHGQVRLVEVTPKGVHVVPRNTDPSGT